MKRLLFSLLFFITATSIYPWAAFAVVLWACFSQRAFLWEFVILALLLDIMWGLYSFGLMNIPIYTIIVITLMILIKGIKDRMRIHA